MLAPWPAHPTIVEIDTLPWLEELGRQRGRAIDLGEVDDATWRRVLPTGTDAVWLMGVWRRSPLAAAVMRSDARVLDEVRGALAAERRDPRARPVDEDEVRAAVVGSAYAVRRYEVDERLGGDAALDRARHRLAGIGIRLVLDVVPNHVAPDHAWVGRHPEWFVPGRADGVEGRDHLTIGGRRYACGRDPHFPPWPDVVQLDAFSAAARDAVVDVLAAIARRCDGVRVDMAQLWLRGVFAATWGQRVGPPPAEEPWAEITRALRRRCPDLHLIAEAYGGDVAQLLALGFDRAYDKGFADALLAADADAVRHHLQGDATSQRWAVRFVENHDERRVAARVSPEHHRAAATVLHTVPGAALWHEGQFEGRVVRTPVVMGRRPDEVPDHALRAFYRALHAVPRPGDDWTMVPTTGWSDDHSHRQLLCWRWGDGASRHLAVVNLASRPAAGRVRLDDGVAEALVPHRPQGITRTLVDVVRDEVFERDADELAHVGLYVQLPPFGVHVLRG